MSINNPPKINNGGIMISIGDYVMIKSLINKGMTRTRVAEHLGIDRKTVYNALCKKKYEGYKRVNKKESKLKPYYEYINIRLEEYNLSSSKLYGEIKKQGYQGKYGILSQYVRNRKKELKNRAVLRFETLPGEQAQVDWGYFGNFYDKEQRKTIKLNCFFMILGYSRALYIEFFDRAHLNNFLKGHNNAFKYFGGYTKEILYDNLKSVVIKRKLKAKDSDFNLKFMDYAGYYGFLPILCRPYKPNTKGKVEKSVDYAKRNFFAGEEFYSLSNLNIKAKEWLQSINNRTHATTHEAPFERLKKEQLNSIGNKVLYDLNEPVYRQVNRDCHFSYEGNKYSVPYKFAGKEVAIKHIDKQTIQVLYRNEEIAKHILNQENKGIYITISSHIEELKILRKSHGIRRPKKKNHNQSINSIFLRFNKQIPKLQSIDLSEYEEVYAL